MLYLKIKNYLKLNYLLLYSKYFFISKFKMSLEPINWTITQALRELKTLDNRIQRLTNETVFVSCGTKNNQRKDDKVHQVVSKYQQSRDLKKRRDGVKAAIVHSNAITTVNVGGQSYTVAEAIERKNSISLDKHLLEQMKLQRRTIKSQMDQQNQAASQRLQRLLEQNFGKDGTKTDPDSLKQTEDAFWVNNRWTMIDPLNLDKEIERLEYEIEEFEKNVDFSLSESNSLNRIQFE